MTQEEPTLFFKEQKENQGMIYGVTKNLSDIYNLINPLFNRAGFNIETTGRGLHIVYPINYKDRAVPFQIFYRKSLSELSKIYFNLPKEITDQTTEQDRVSYVLSKLKESGVHTYIQLPNYFILVRYWDFPIEAWNLTYRTSKDRLNRMILKTVYINRMLLHNSKLQETLNKIWK